jgi:hypothetical protein
MTTLTAGLAVQRATGAGAALADIERDFVTELHGLERTTAVQWITAIPARTSTGNVISLHLSELANTARICAAAAAAGAHRD